MRVCPSCRHQFPAGSNFCPHDGHRLEDLPQGLSPKDPFLGMVLDDRYKVESLLGSGGMGNVYAARHIVIDKPVAIKILRLEYSKDPRQAERFIREARAASRIGHPNIVDVTDFGRLDNGQIFFVMEYLVGVTLAGELRKRGAQPPRRVLNLGIQICNALGAAHSKGIVHRDLKPENVFIVNPITAKQEEDAAGRQQDSIKLLDFGIAKITWDEQQRRLTKVGSIFGTPQYMSPEQAAGKDTDLRGDVYALGCIVYEMLTGELPFIADTFMGTLTKQMFENPVPPRQLRPDLGILAPLELLVLRAMEKDPDKRFQTMQELANALEQCYELGEIGPAQRAPVVVLPPEGSAVAAITDKKLETVHLLVKEREDPTAPEVETAEPGAEEWGGTIGAGGATAPTVRRWTWVWAVLLFVLLSGVGIFVVLRLTSSPAPKGRVVVLRSDVDATAVTKKPQQRAAQVPDAGPSSASRPPTNGRTVVKVRFDSEPGGAMLIRGGRSVGRCPRTESLRAGRGGSFILRLAGYKDSVLKIAPRSDEDHTVRLQPLRRPKKIITTPYGSTKDLRTPLLFKGKDKPPKRNP
jgi:eukaryotic-like serine/threonine-protein kinase